MSMKYLGDRFDIHTGGNDLRFPASRGRDRAVRGRRGPSGRLHWVHGGFLRLTGQKIAKSTGNAIRAPELIERGLDPLAFRWLAFQTRYRSRWTSRVGGDGDGRPTRAQLRRHVAGGARPPSSDPPARTSTPGSARRRRTTWTCRRPFAS